jgi:AcrR family transcriptional regulator
MKDKVQNILDHVSKLYHRYGIKSITMDDVARNLGISKKTLYEHFRDKKDLVGQVLQSEYEPGLPGFRCP